MTKTAVAAPDPDDPWSHCIAIGDYSLADGRSAVAIGRGAEAHGQHAVALGHGARAVGNGAVAIGRLYDE